MRKVILLTFIALNFIHAPQSFAFEETHVRYLSTPDLMRILSQKFTYGSRFIDSAECNMRGIGPSILGLPSPTTGEPVIKTPSPAFIKWYAKCLNTVVREETESAVRYHQENRMLPTNVYLRIQSFLNKYGNETGIYTNDILGVYWNSLHDRIQLSIISFWIENLIGKNIIANQEILAGQIADMVTYRAKPKTLKEALNHIIFIIAMRDEFLTY